MHRDRLTKINGDDYLQDAFRVLTRCIGTSPGAKESEEEFATYMGSGGDVFERDRDSFCTRFWIRFYFLED